MLPTAHTARTILRLFDLMHISTYNTYCGTVPIPPAQRAKRPSQGLYINHRVFGQGEFISVLGRRGTALTLPVALPCLPMPSSSKRIMHHAGRYVSRTRRSFALYLLSARTEHPLAFWSMHNRALEHPQSYLMHVNRERAVVHILIDVQHITRVVLHIFRLI